MAERIKRLPIAPRQVENGLKATDVETGWVNERALSELKAAKCECRDTKVIVAERWTETGEWASVEWIRGCECRDRFTEWSLHASSSLTMWRLCLLQLFGTDHCYSGVHISDTGLWCLVLRYIALMEAWCGWVALAHNPLQGTLQSHEWLPFSLFTLQISRTKAALAPLIKQLHSLWGSRVFLSTESFKTWTRHSCEHCHQQQLVTGHQQFVIVFMPAIPPSLWPMVSDFYRWAWVLFRWRKNHDTFAFQSRSIWHWPVTKLHGGMVEKWKASTENIHHSWNPTFGARCY